MSAKSMKSQQEQIEEKKLYLKTLDIEVLELLKEDDQYKGINIQAIIDLKMIENRVNNETPDADGNEWESQNEFVKSWKYKELGEGAEIIGTYQGSRELLNKDNEKFLVHDFKLLNGTMISVDNSHNINKFVTSENGIKAIANNQIIKIVFTGTVKLKGGKSCNSFDIFTKK